MAHAKAAVRKVLYYHARRLYFSIARSIVVAHCVWSLELY